MAGELKNGLEEFFGIGAATANAVRGAVKTGRAVAGAVKSAAAGGPYGAVAGALWEGRRHIGKIAAAAAALLMLPVLYLVMLPGRCLTASCRGSAPLTLLPRY